MSTLLKWVLGVLVALAVFWAGAVQWFSRGGGEGRLETADSLQAKMALAGDSLRRDSLPADTTQVDSVKAGGELDTMRKNELTLPQGSIDTKGAGPQEVVAFAKTLIGVPYRYGSTDPAQGFDCSGFITYVFRHFNIVVPRSSIDFTNVGTEVSAARARTGDLILFTGTDSTERFVGHMGIVVENSDSLRFIHSTSGKQYGVTITPLNRYYQGRYVKTIRIFP